MARKTQAQETRDANVRAARAYIGRVGRDVARRDSDAEIAASVFDVTYPMGRVGMYRAIRDVLDGEV